MKAVPQGTCRASHRGMDNRGARVIHLPSIRALDTSDDGLLRQELRYLAVRQQVAVVKALVDRLDGLDPAGTSCFSGELVQELARLGCTILETAAAMSKMTEPAPESGILPLGSSDTPDAS